MEPIRRDEYSHTHLLEALPVAVYRCDAEGRLQYFNKAMAAILGWKPKLGSDRWAVPCRVYRPDGQLLLLDQWVTPTAGQNQTAIRGKELVFERPHGVRRHVLAYQEPIHDASGQIVGSINTLVDITKLREAEKMLRDANDTLERRVAERTAELRALTLELTQAEMRERKRIAKVLHDEIQQLLVGVKIQTSFARSLPGSTAPMLEAIRLTDEAIAACHALVAGLSPPMPRDTDLADALNWLCKQMAERYRLRVEIAMDGPPPFLSEELRLLIFEATREMLFNVVKHAGVDRATVSIWGDDELVRLEVKDEGRGCDPAVLERPGPEHFGLVSIRERVANLGGRFQATSAPGRGSTFRIAVPHSSTAARPAASPIPAAHAKGPSDDRRDGVVRVLLADDHRIVRQALARLLDSQTDIQVVGQASDGVETLELARKLRPDIVLMDVTMPRMSGVEATRRIRSEMPKVRVVGLSVYEYEDMATTMREAGASQYLHKGGPVEELFAAVRGAT